MEHGTSDKQSKTESKSERSKNKEAEEDSDEEDLDLSDESEGSSSASTSTSDELSGTSEGKQKKMSWLLSKKKAVASRAATSSVGKALFKKFVDKETVQLLRVVKTLVARQHGEKKAKQVKNNITKLAVKVLILYDSKKLTAESFDGLEFYFRRSCSTIKNAWQRKTLDEDTLKRVVDLLQQFETKISAVLKPFVTEKTMKRLTDTSAVLANLEFMKKAVKEPEFDKVVLTLAYYLEEYK